MTDSPGRDSSRLGDLRHRARYRFDNLLARGTWAALLWLGMVTLAVVLLSAVLLVAFGVRREERLAHPEKYPPKEKRTRIWDEEDE